MKKIMILSLIVIVCVAMAAPVFAANWNGVLPAGAAVTTVIAGATFSPSTGVYVSACTDATGLAYAMSAVHNSSLNSPSGKVYGATSTESTIKYIMAPAAVATYQCAAGTPALAPATGWTQ